MSVLLIRLGVSLVFGVAFLIYCIRNSRKNNQQELSNSIRSFDGRSIKTCCICLCELLLGQEEISSLPCKHKFHKNCIKGVFNYQESREKTCPLCRQAVQMTIVESIIQ